MNRLIVIGAAVAASVAIPGTAFAQTTQASDPIRSPLVNDCGRGSVNGDCMGLDMVGTFAGIVKSRHKANGNLRLMVVIKSGAKDTDYGLEIYCGPGPQNPGTLVGSLAGAVHTDKYGAGVAGPFEVPAADLSSACGSRAVGHIQLVNVAGGTILSGGPVDMVAH